MKLKLGVFLGWLGFARGGSFAQDVIHPSLRADRLQQQQYAMESELLSRAMPLAEYKKMLEDHGLSMPSRDLAEQNNQQNDFYLDDDVMYSFSGYAMKYATCQPVQYFSEDAIRAGEHSPMLTQDIVILRLCPSNVCSSTSRYGCHYNFAEYALTLPDYLQVMLQFRGYQRDNVCEWCNQCSNSGSNANANEENGNGRRLEDNGMQDADGQENNNGEQQQEEANQNDNGEQNNNANQEDNVDQEDNANQEENDNANQNNNEEQEDNANQNNNENQANNENQNNNANQDEAEGCDKYYDTYCSDYSSMCVDNQDGGNEDSSYVDYDLYLGYLGCTEAEYNGYGYFVRPRCDGSENTIEMAVYYDQYCVQAADGVNIKSLGLGFHQSTFQEFYSPDCIDCSESQYPPYFDTGSAFCNNLHYASAKCTEDLMYDLFDGEVDQSSECTFIEGIRFGAYDSSGLLSTAHSSNVWNAEASSIQTFMILISLGAVIFFIVYACYLHHAMTNLLIKSLSHRELLPANRQQRRRQLGDSSVVSAKRRPSDDHDWQSTKPV